MKWSLLILVIGLALVAGAIFPGMIMGTMQRETTGRTLQFGPDSFSTSADEIAAVLDQPSELNGGVAGSLPWPEAGTLEGKTFISLVSKNVRLAGTTDAPYQKFLFVPAGEEKEVVEYQILLAAQNYSASEARLELRDQLERGVVKGGVEFEITEGEGEISQPENWVNGEPASLDLPANKSVVLQITFKAEAQAERGQAVVDTFSVTRGEEEIKDRAYVYLI